MSIQYSVTYALILQRQYKSMIAIVVLPSLYSYGVLEKHRFLYSTLSQPINEIPQR